MLIGYHLETSTLLDILEKLFMYEHFEFLEYNHEITQKCCTNLLFSQC